MIEWSQKSRPQKIPRASSKTQKNPWTKNWPPKNPMPILWPLKVPERGNAITQRKTLEIEHSCLFIHHTIWIYPSPHLILFNTPKKILTQIKLPKFSYPQKFRNWKFQTQKNPSIIPVTWNPKYPPWGKNTKFECDSSKTNEDIAQICEILQTKLNFIVGVTKLSPPYQCL